MQKICLALCSTTLAALSFSNIVHAAAYQFYELGTPILATAAVGQAAVANDASTSYFNPAGMALLPSTQFMIGSEIIVPKINFAKNHMNTISGDNGGNAGSLTPGVGMYYVYNFSPCFKFGISLTSPYGGALNYNDGWAGRFIVQDLLFYTLNLNPAIAYKINNWAALGAGFSVEYCNIHQTVALPLKNSVDGQANVKVDNFAPGFNVGLMLTPGQNTKLGLAYRSRITHHLKGETTFLRIPFTPVTQSKIIMPQNVIMSLAQDLTCKFTVLGEAGWSNWSAMQNDILTISGFTATTVLDWHDTYRVGLGGQYKLTPKVLLQSGVSYDSSPTGASHRVPDLPMDRQIRAGAGFIYSVFKAAKLGFSYEYINYGKAKIDNLSSNGTLAGSYSRNYAGVVQASINVDV